MPILVPEGNLLPSALQLRVEKLTWKDNKKHAINSAKIKQASDSDPFESADREKQRPATKTHTDNKALVMPLTKQMLRLSCSATREGPLLRIFP
jgi:hypothetical protein